MSKCQAALFDVHWSAMLYPAAEKSHEGPCCPRCLASVDYALYWHEGTDCCCRGSRLPILSSSTPEGGEGP